MQILKNGVVIFMPQTKQNNQQQQQKQQQQRELFFRYLFLTILNR